MKTIRSAVRLMLLTGMVGVCAFGQTPGTPSAPLTQPPTKTRMPTPGAYVVDCYIAEAAPGSTYESGPMHVVYSDGTHLVEHLPRKQPSTSQHVVANAQGFSEGQLADDRQTLGWTVTFDGCCQSYSIPLLLTIFRAGKVIQHIAPGQMIWGWMFRPGGQQVVVVSGPTHGTFSGDIGLFDVNSGKRLAEVFGDEETGASPPDPPQWAKEMDANQNSGTGCKAHRP